MRKGEFMQLSVGELESLEGEVVKIEREVQSREGRLLWSNLAPHNPKLKLEDFLPKAVVSTDQEQEGERLKRLIQASGTEKINFI